MVALDRLHRCELAQQRQLAATQRGYRMASAELWTDDDAAILGRIDSAIYSAARDRLGAWSAWDCSVRWIRHLNA